MKDTQLKRLGCVVVDSLRDFFNHKNVSDGFLYFSVISNVASVPGVSSQDWFFFDSGFSVSLC
jgi:hypothetical protein